jgi:tRNA U34 5-carboxymethylaminomethyl modifying GTPase MnmE/TrmE
MAEKKENPVPPQQPPAPKAELQAQALEAAISTQQYTSKIEAIKDIIFGEDYAALRLAIRELHERIDREHAAMDEKFSSLIQETDRAINHKIDTIEMDLKSEIDRLDYNKTDRFKLGKMLEEIGRSLQER